MRTIVSSIRAIKEIATAGGITKVLQATGRMPPVSILVTPLDRKVKPFALDSFLSYKFNSSMLVPVNTFEFAFAAPDDSRPFDHYVKDGDMIALFGGGLQLATGIIDSTDVEIDREFGEKITISGRDLLGQLEDQDAVSLNNETLWGNAESIKSGAGKLIRNTRIPNIATRNASTKTDWLLATEPGESKLAALQRFIEPMNVLCWGGVTGTLIIGKPNMSQAPKGAIICSKSKRDSNVLSIRATRHSTTIPNIILPVWSGQESVQSRITPRQRAYNQATGPKRLRMAGNLLPKCVVISNPQGNSPQDLAEVNQIKALGADRLQAYAKRELAKQNMKELDVMCKVAGHYNELGQPYLTDTVYNVEFDRGNVNQKMYLYAVEYDLTEQGGQTTDLHFCNLGTIVADITVR